MNEDILTLTAGLVALIAGLLLGWFLGGRGAAHLRTERDARTDDLRRAITDLAAAEERAKAVEPLRADLERIRDERDAGRTELATLRAEAAAFDARLVELREAKDVMAAQFDSVANKLLDKAQEKFLERAHSRFRESEEMAGQHLKAMLQPVNERLLRYEEGVARIEAERRDAFGDLKGQIEAMRLGQEKVSSEAAKLVNSLRNAPKSRGRWGEQQLRNVLENCGLAEHTDFRTEVSIASGDEGERLRPDAIINIPGGRSLVIDAKVSLNAYQDAFGAVDEAERNVGLAAHAQSMRTHVTGLGNKAYWNQFADAPDYVIMFVPGEHFLSAALEHDPTLWDFAFEKRVLLATPTNLIAIARTVAAVWRQERLAKEARQIGDLGKELYDRLNIASDHLRRVGGGLRTAVDSYNRFTNSFESRVLVTARKLGELSIKAGAKEMTAIDPVESLPRYGEDQPGNSVDAGAVMSVDN